MPFDHALAQGGCLKTEERFGYINTAQDIYRHYALGLVSISRMWRKELRGAVCSLTQSLSLQRQLAHVELAASD